MTNWFCIRIEITLKTVYSLCKLLGIFSEFNIDLIWFEPTLPSTMCRNSSTNASIAMMCLWRDLYMYIGSRVENERSPRSAVRSSALNDCESVSGNVAYIPGALLRSAHHLTMQVISVRDALALRQGALCTDCIVSMHVYCIVSRALMAARVLWRRISDATRCAVWRRTSATRLFGGCALCIATTTATRPWIKVLQ